MSVVIVGTASYLPERVVTNHELESMPGVDYERVRAGGISLDEWARQHHGGISRHWRGPQEATSDMATEAARRALRTSGLSVSDIDLIVMTTITNDYRLPQAAGIVQANLGSKAKFIQIDSACTGFVDGLMVSQGLMQTHGYENVLLIGADTLTYFNDPEKFMPLTVFGDGAGAVILQKRPDLEGYGIASFSTGSDGEFGDYVWVPGGASRKPFSQEVLDNGLQYWRFKFPEINAWAVERFCRCTLEVVSKTGLTLEDVNWIVPHQASVNIIMDVVHRLEVPEEMAVITYPHTGNLSGASIPVAIDEAVRQAKFSDGDWLVMPAVGAGMAWGAASYRWYDYELERSGSGNGHAGSGNGRADGGLA